MDGNIMVTYKILCDADMHTEVLLSDVVGGIDFVSFMDKQAFVLGFFYCKSC